MAVALLIAFVALVGGIGWRMYVDPRTKSSPFA
jgi:hypothetical protein